MTGHGQLNRNWEVPHHSSARSAKAKCARKDAMESTLTSALNVVGSSSTEASSNTSSTPKTLGRQLPRSNPPLRLPLPPHRPHSNMDTTIGRNMDTTTGAKQRTTTRSTTRSGRSGTSSRTCSTDRSRTVFQSSAPHQLHVSRRSLGCIRKYQVT